MSLDLARGRELLPCPFCGVAPALNEFAGFGKAQICCENDDCAIQPHTEYSDRDPVPEWNRRAARRALAGEK